MKTPGMPPLIEYFKDIQAPRVERNTRHSLLDIIVVTFLAVLYGAEGWEDIEEYAQCKEPWLAQFGLLKNGLPHHDTDRRVFTSLIPQQMEECFMAWVRSIKREIPREVIAIDGKTSTHTAG